MSFRNRKNNELVFFVPVMFVVAVLYVVLESKKVDEIALVEDNTSQLEEDVEASDNLITENNKENMEIGKEYTTDSGLKYEVLVLGDGEKPEATSIVEVHYHGTLEDGTVFDSSVQRGQTIEFGLYQVISGWTEGLQLMPVGSKFKFTIPANLAYGDASPSPLIPGGSTLIFEVELFAVK